MKMFIVSSCRVVPVEALPYKAVSLEHVPGLAVGTTRSGKMRTLLGDRPLRGDPPGMKLCASAAPGIDSL